MFGKKKEKPDQIIQCPHCRLMTMKNKRCSNPKCLAVKNY